jgi:hypothetical protein
MKNYYYMWVGISEAIRLLSTCLLLISRSKTLIIEFINKEKCSLIPRDSLVLDTAHNTMSAEGDTKTNIDSDMPEDTKISTKTTGGNNGSPKSTDGDVGKAMLV